MSERETGSGGPRVVHAGPLRWAGLGARTSNAAEMDPSTARIAGLWQRFLAEAHGKALPARLPYGVYSDYESDVNGPYTLTVGVRVGEDEPVDGALAQVRAPAATYLVFEGRGEMPALVFRLWQEVWDHFAADRTDYRRAYGVDFEEHRAPDEVAIHVSVRAAGGR